jgi:hypothetical protein
MLPSISSIAAINSQKVELKMEVMKLGAFLLASGLALPAAAATAEPTSLAGDELRRAVSGKTVYLNVSGFELPIHYAPDGRMSGKMGAAAASLSLHESASDTGRWWIKDHQLCQRWTSWMERKSYCYELTRQGKTVQWVRNDGRSGTARLSG